ncbi:MAG: ribulose-phosphate 3-epimerase [Parcubacteria group bacterium LiPW_39]|nr:MAG: ribulose-phosphate 3-epimerase [Parcubacteria group bacterium LiPW_39]
MPEIIPAIIAKDFEDLKNKIKLVEPYVKTVQLDIMDGVFVPNITWRNPADLANLETPLFLEAHLMIANPHQFLNEWFKSKVERIILHWEAIQISDFRLRISDLIQEMHKKNKEFGLALNLETQISVLDDFIDKIDLVLLMSVNPGFAGQEFQESVIPKIAALRQEYPDVKIGVDGGINLQNVKKLVEAGADFLAVGSAIFEAENPAKVINQLKEAVR